MAYQVFRNKKQAQIIEKFLDRVQKTDKCWPWLGYKEKNGYGYGHVWFNRKQVRTHRVSYILFKGKIPKNMYVLHTCDNPPCVRPDHLFLGTQKDNIQDMLKKGRGSKRDRSGKNNGNSKLSYKKAEKIRKMYYSGEYTYKKIGLLFGVSIHPIYQIVNNKIWKIYEQ